MTLDLEAIKERLNKEISLDAFMNIGFRLPLRIDQQDRLDLIAEVERLQHIEERARSNSEAMFSGYREACKELSEKNAKLREALEFYADASNYHDRLMDPPSEAFADAVYPALIHCDWGAKARKVLEETKDE